MLSSVAVVWSMLIILASNISDVLKASNVTLALSPKWSLATSASDTFASISNESSEITPATGMPALIVSPM